MRTQICLLALGLGVLGLGCEPESTRPPLPGSLSPTCERGTSDGILLPFGFLNRAQYWDCNLPRAGTGGLAVSGHDGAPAAVTGGSISLDLEWTGGTELFGRMVVLGIQGRKGYWVVYPASNDNPLKAEIYVDRNASAGTYNLVFYVDDGSGTPEAPSVGAGYQVPFTVIPVGSGDVQVSLSWNTATDVDLHVVDPADEEIFYGNLTSASGGELDLDSNAACGIDGKNNENIFWPEGGAPRGEYIVRVDYWSACAVTADPTRYRVTILLGDGTFDVHEGEFQPGDADGGGTGDGVEVTRFTW